MVKTFKFDSTKLQLVWKPSLRARTATNAELSSTSVLNVSEFIPRERTGRWDYKVMISGSVVDLGSSNTEIGAQIAAEQSLARIVQSLPNLEIIKTAKEQVVERSELFRKIKEVVADELNLKFSFSAPGKTPVTEESVIHELGADSLDVITIAMRIEDEFSIEFDDEEIEKIKTIGDIVDLAVRKVK